MWLVGWRFGDSGLASIFRFKGEFDLGEGDREKGWYELQGLAENINV